MRRLVAIVLVSLLLVPPATAGQHLGAWIEWDSARTLRAGTEIMVVTVRDGPPIGAKILFVDDSMLVTLKGDAKVADKIQRALLEVGHGWPGILNGAGAFARGDVRISPHGIFHGDRKVAELSDVVQQTPRGEVRGLTRVVHEPHLGRYVLLGALIGIATVLGMLAGTLSGT